MCKLLIVAAVALSFATPAFADYYIVKDLVTKHCAIAELPPRRIPGVRIVAVYASREEAAAAMKSAKVCER